MKFPLLLLLALLPFTAGRAEQFDRSSVRALCAKAGAIVFGRVLNGDTVRVEKWILPDPSLQPLPETITISRLSQHLRKPGWPSPSSEFETNLPLRRFVAFLEGSNPTWQCVSTIADDPSDPPEVGSSGLFWILDGKCYAYAQYCNPGPYYLNLVEDLTKGGEDYDSPYGDRLETVTTEARLIAEIDAGLKDLAVWKAALREPDPPRKAQRLAAYYLPGTSPVGKRRTFLIDVEKHLTELEEAAVPALVETLELRQPGDDLTALLWNLRRLSSDTQAAIPELCELLGSPLERPPSYVLDCLGRTQNPLIAPAVWPFLYSPYPGVSKDAASALGSIVPEGLSPEDLAKRSPFVALVRLFPPSASNPPGSTRLLARALLRKNLKGTLPKYFVIEPFPGLPADTQRISETTALVFLHQDESGRYYPSTPESVKRLFNNDRVEWPRAHGLPLEKIQEAIRASASDVSPAGS